MASNSEKPGTPSRSGATKRKSSSPATYCWQARRDRARSRVEADSETLEQRAEQGADSLLVPPDTPEALLIKATLSDDLRTALDALPEPFREAVWLRDVEELSYQEIAEVLAIPIGTVMSRLSRGRRQLYNALTAAGRNVRGAAAS